MGLACIIRNHRILLKVVDTKENPWAELALQMDLPLRPGCVIPRLCEVGLLSTLVALCQAWY